MNLMNNYFCGCYFKCQSKEKSIAIIPAFHRYCGKDSCSIQVITDTDSYSVTFPASHFHKKKDGFVSQIGNNVFSTKGLNMNIHSKYLKLTGTVRFQQLRPLCSDIMGPFHYMPLLECRHQVISMRHRVIGTLVVNGEPYVFQQGLGYIEGDRGTSFPTKYLWTQSFFPAGSIMLSVADVPIGLFKKCSFTGIICAIVWKGKEYRLATYLGATIVKLTSDEIIIRQGRYELSVKRFEKEMKHLSAPVKGKMMRTIGENLSCHVSYCLKKEGEILFAFETKNASFEYEYSQESQFK